MLKIESRLQREAAPAGTASVELRLTYAQRRKAGLVVTLKSGEQVEINTQPGEVLRGGDLLALSDGRVAQVLAEAEGLVHIEDARPALLARIAYELGNRHMPVEIGEGYLRAKQGTGIEDYVKGLGVRPRRMIAPFEPEAALAAVAGAAGG